MIWAATGSKATWMTIIVRAATEEGARELALAKVREYIPDEQSVTVWEIEVDGPDEILLVDDS